MLSPVSNLSALLNPLQSDLEHHNSTGPAPLIVNQMSLYHSSLYCAHCRHLGIFTDHILPVSLFPPHFLCFSVAFALPPLLVDHQWSHVPGLRLAMPLLHPSLGALSSVMALAYPTLTPPLQTNKQTEKTNVLLAGFLGSAHSSSGCSGSIIESSLSSSPTCH